MNNLNIGDTVICVDDSDLRTTIPKIKKGNKYIINETRTFCCGIVGVDIGMIYQDIPREYKCPICGRVKSNYSDIVYYKIERFRKLEPFIPYSRDSGRGEN